MRGAIFYSAQVTEYIIKSVRGFIFGFEVNYIFFLRACDVEGLRIWRQVVGGSN